MMSWIVRSSLRFRFIVVALAATMMFVGVIQLPNSKVDVFPEFAPPKVEVQTLALGLTAAEVEELVTVPLEQALNGVPDLDVMRSKSVPQLSQIELIFEHGHRPPRRAAAGAGAHRHRDARRCPPGRARRS